MRVWTGASKQSERLPGKQRINDAAEGGRPNNVIICPISSPLDHVYVRGLRAESAEVIPVDSSDHNPLRVKLALE